MVNYKPTCRKPEKYTKELIMNLVYKHVPCTVMQLFRVAEKELGCRAYNTVKKKLKLLEMDGRITVHIIPEQRMIVVRNGK